LQGAFSLAKSPLICPDGPRQGKFTPKKFEMSFSSLQDLDAVSVELSCREKFDGSAQEILAGFLSNCHYAA